MKAKTARKVLRKNEVKIARHNIKQAILNLSLQKRVKEAQRVLLKETGNV